MIDENIFAQLSGVVTDEFENIDTSELLSVIDTLSGRPIHPYEALKYDLFGPDYTFKTIDDIPTPEHVCLSSCNIALKTVTQIHTDNITAHLENFSLSAYHESPQDYTHLGHAFTVLSGDKHIIDFDKTKKYVEFLEVVRSIDPYSVNESNSQELIHKLLSCHASIYS
jgi:hypothetical protein